MENFFVYILFSEKLDKYYVGSTKHLDVRLAEHNRGKSSYTRLGIPWYLVHTEEFPSKPLAVRREYEIKGMKSRKYIESLF